MCDNKCLFLNKFLHGSVVFLDIIICFLCILGIYIHCVLCILQCRSCLYRKRKRKCGNKHNKRKCKQPYLKSYRYGHLIIIGFMNTAPKPARNKEQSQSRACHTYTRKYYHRYRAGAYHIKCHFHIISVCNEHNIHMKDFHYRTHKERIKRRRFFTLEQIYFHTCRNKTRKAGGNAARYPCICTYSEICTDYIPLYTADKTRNYTRIGVKEQACRKRGNIAHIQRHFFVSNTKMCGKYCTNAVQYAYKYPFAVCHNTVSAIYPLPQRGGNDNIQTCDKRHFNYH